MGLHCYDGHRTEHDFDLRKKETDASAARIQAVSSSLCEKGYSCRTLLLGGSPSMPLKKVVKGIVRNYRKELARRQAKEVSFCELPEIVVEKLIVWDDYESEYTTFDVCGTEIRVLDEELAEALKQLPEQSRNIVLMFFFLDMSDSEIGEKLNINRSTSYRHRRNSLEEIRKQLKEKKTNEE